MREVSIFRLSRDVNAVRFNPFSFYYSPVPYMSGFGSTQPILRGYSSSAASWIIVSVFVTRLIDF